MELRVKGLSPVSAHSLARSERSADEWITGANFRRSVDKDSTAGEGVFMVPFTKSFREYFVSNVHSDKNKSFTGE